MRRDLLGRTENRNPSCQNIETFLRKNSDYSDHKRLSNMQLKKAFLERKKTEERSLGLSLPQTKSEKVPQAQWLGFSLFYFKNEYNIFQHSVIKKITL